MTIYLDRRLLDGSSHIDRWQNCRKWGRRATVQPFAVTVLLRIGFTWQCSLLHPGELLPRLSTLTHGHRCDCGRYISVALFLGSPPADVIRYPCPMEPGLSSPPPVSPEEDDDEAATVWSASARSIEGLRALVTPRCAFQSPVSRRYYVKHGRYCHKPRGMLRPTYLCWSIR